MGTQEARGVVEVQQMLDRTREELKQRKANIKCDEACRILTQLGFEVRDGKRGGHKVYTHDHLPSFTSSSLDCGHGRNDEIKPGYIRKIISVLDMHEADLVDYILKEGER